MRTKCPGLRKRILVSHLHFFLHLMTKPLRLCQGRAEGGGLQSTCPPTEFFRGMPAPPISDPPPPEGFWTVVFYLSNVCKYYHLLTEIYLNFLKNLSVMLYFCPLLSRDCTHNFKFLPPLQKSSALTCYQFINPHTKLAFLNMRRQMQHFRFVCM